MYLTVSCLLISYKFFGPQMALAYRLDAISQGPKKLSNSRAQPPTTCPRNGYARIQNIMHGLYKSYVHK
jgi:hypothetical protein